MINSYDVIIIGGGIVGCSCAKHIAERGHDVMLLESAMIGGGTTAAGMGHIVVLDDSEAQFQFCKYSRSLWSELAENIGEQIEWNKCGTLWVAADDEEMQAVHTRYEYYNSRGVAVEILDENELMQAEPNLRKGFRGGLRVPDDAVLYPPGAAKWFADKAVESGCTIKEYTEVVSVDDDGSVFLKDGSSVNAKVVIIAAGYRSSELVREVPILKRKGHLVVTDRYPDLINHQIIELGYLKSAHSISKESVAFNVHPCANGKVLIGSSRQFEDDSKEVDFNILAKMLDRSFEYMPKLKDISAIRSWAGFRPATPDKMPYIGPFPGSEAIWLATGHEGYGITTSIATGRIISEMLDNVESEISIEPFLPDRLMAEKV